VPREQIKSRLQLRAQESPQSEAQPASRARPGFPGQVVAELLPDDAGQASQAAFGQEEILRSQALLGSINPAGAARAEQGVLHIGGDPFPGEPAAAPRGAEEVEPPQVNPTLD